MLRTGAGPTKIGQLLNHKSQQTTARYSDLLQNPKRQVAEQVGQAPTKVMNGDVE